MIFDPIYLLFILPGLFIGIWAQIKLSHAYSKFSKVPVESGMTGAQAAREILDRSGLDNVPVAEVPGHLSDHYDPTKRALFLSSENDERAGVSKVLNAAALTYVAALVSAILNLLYYISLSRRN